MKQRSEDAKPFNKSFADRVWNGRLFARAYALINEGYHKIKWKVSNKTPVAMYVDSEPVRQREQWLVLSSKYFEKLEKNASVVQKRESVKEWVEVFKGLLTNPNETARKIKSFQEMRDWAYTFFVVEEMPKGKLHDTLAGIFKTNCSAKELQQAKKAKKPYTFRLWQCSCPCYQHYLICKDCIAMGYENHAFPWPDRLNPEGQGKGPLKGKTSAKCRKGSMRDMS